MTLFHYYAIKAGIGKTRKFDHLVKSPEHQATFLILYTPSSHFFYA
ncbi:hypothetical protein B6N60_04818 [Richelia sinica FACHB-800]|uniref:Uncharacterized protein n=1 Tax=Richelia sinica FACHB-800 TaxID=1357546 RepID=A0A975TDG2_9NOST|nr:hypothetical protein B6N60_04818 [Richelia sinica FACHB-800]